MQKGMGFEACHNALVSMEVYAALNAIGEVAWSINKPVLEGLTSALGKCMGV